MKEIANLGTIPRTDGKGSRTMVRYQCECGVTVDKFKDKKALTQKCQSCRGKEVGKRFTKHGLSGSKLQSIWSGMISRCYRPGSKGYKSYGAKGVTVCDEWRNSFTAFSNWAVSVGYVEGHDKDLDKDLLCGQLGIHPKIYSPETCQWLDKRSNRAKVPKTEIPKIVKLRKSGLLYREIAKIYNVTDSCIRNIVKTNLSKTE